jgi:hypothetical protein
MIDEGHNRLFVMGPPLENLDWKGGSMRKHKRLCLVLIYGLCIHFRAEH